MRSAALKPFALASRWPLRSSGPWNGPGSYFSRTPVSSASRQASVVLASPASHLFLVILVVYRLIDGGYARHGGLVTCQCVCDWVW